MSNQKFIITERDPLNISIVDELKSIALKTRSKHAVRTRAIELIIKEISNPTIGMVGRYMTAVGLI